MLLIYCRTLLFGVPRAVSNFKSTVSLFPIALLPAFRVAKTCPNRVLGTQLYIFRESPVASWAPVSS